LKKGLIFTIILAAIAFTSIGMWGDVLKAGNELRNFPWYLIPLIAFFGFMNDMIKFGRWHIYLKKMGYETTLKESLVIFVSGLSMSATPGKIGLLIKSQMLKKLSGRSFISSTPVIAAELYMDMIGLSVISLLAVGLFAKGMWAALILCVLPLLALNQKFSGFCIDILAKIPSLKHRADDLRKAVDDMFGLFGFRTLIASFAITLIAWTSEGVALTLILNGLGFDMGIIKSTAIFGFSTLIGVISMLPGGLIVTDAGLMGLIVHEGVPAQAAGLATIMARVFTLWLAVGIGSIVLFINRKYIYGNIREVS
jgi:uncharacterized protein (TIRG00374 family)